MNSCLYIYVLLSSPNAMKYHTIRIRILRLLFYHYLLTHSVFIKGTFFLMIINCIVFHIVWTWQYIFTNFDYQWRLIKKSYLNQTNIWTHKILFVAVNITIIPMLQNILAYFMINELYLSIVLISCNILLFIKSSNFRYLLTMFKCSMH